MLFKSFKSIAAFKAVLSAAQWFIEIARDPARPPDLSMLVVEVPGFDHPRFVDTFQPGCLDQLLTRRRPDLLRKTKLDCRVDFFYTEGLTRRFFFYGDGGLLDRFLDLGRSTVLALRTFDPELAQVCETRTTLGEAHQIEMAWPWMMTSYVSQREFEGVADRVRWPDNFCVDVPYYEDRLKEYQEMRAAVGLPPLVHVPPGDVNVTLFADNAFAVSADILGHLSDAIYAALEPADREALSREAEGSKLTPTAAESEGKGTGKRKRTTKGEARDKLRSCLEGLIDQGPLGLTNLQIAERADISSSQLYELMKIEEFGKQIRRYHKISRGRGPAREGNS